MAHIVWLGHPHDIVQRGRNRQLIFAQEEDYVGHLANLQELKLTFGIGLCVYRRMTNRVHLLLTPQECGAVMECMT